MIRRILAICLSLAAMLNANAHEWAPAGDGMKTKWTSEVKADKALPEYPRPQLVRSEWQSLNGLWDYAITPDNAGYSGADGQILVPFAVESSLSGVQKKVGKGNALWYERSFTVPRSWKGREVMLNFGAVDWKAEIWVNGSLVGSHSGGYTPFSFNITPYLKRSGKQTLRVKVIDWSDDSYQPRGKQVTMNRGVWYTSVTGIWQSVWLEPVNATRVESYLATADLENSTLRLTSECLGIQDTDTVQVDVLEGYSAECPGTKVIASAVMDKGSAEIQIPDAKTWSPDSPYLYGLKISILRNGKLLDQVNGYAAMRSVSVWKSDSKDRNTNFYNRLALNGKPLFHFGPLDQGWWPDGLYTAPTDEALRYDIAQTKAWGFNMIRKHIKVEPARWYWWCDLLGMMVWQDMPCIGDNERKPRGRSEEVLKNTASVWAYDTFIGGSECENLPQEAKDNYYKEWGEIIRSFRSFPCICVWVPFNEGWGQFDTPEVTAFTKQLDPTRLVNAASGGVFRLCGDIQDCHHYASPAMNAFESKMANVIGEYGGLGFPVEGHTWNQKDNWGYGKLFETPDDVMKTYAKFTEMLKTFISVGCTGAVYTQTTDVEIEINGLMTYDRIPKFDEALLKSLNSAVISSMTE